LGESSPIGQLFTRVSFRKSAEIAQIFWLLFTYVSTLTKMSWAIFWATFSHTHLVTLAQTSLKNSPLAYTKRDMHWPEEAMWRG
jgi:hypothetical protein